MMPSAEGLIGRAIGGYLLERMVGSGGAAAVYLGRRVQEPHDEVAVKVLLPPTLATMTQTQIAEFRARFTREANTIGQQLHHPHILPVLATGEDTTTGLAYMVTPYIMGGTLSSRVAMGVVPLDQAAEYITQLASALDYAHAQNVVHRDIKPGNVLIDSNNQVMLADFGIAKLIDTPGVTLTDTGRTIGTPEYMSPEQAHGDPVTARTDVYGLGMVAYHLVTGQLPFPAATVGQMLVQVLTLPPITPRQFRPDLPDPLVAVILKALAKDPAQRFASAGAFAASFGLGVQGQWSPEMLAAATGAFPLTPTLGQAGSGNLPPTDGFETPPTSYGPGRGAGDGGYRDTTPPARRGPFGKPLVITSAVIALALVVCCGGSFALANALGHGTTTTPTPPNVGTQGAFHGTTPTPTLLTTVGPAPKTPIVVIDNRTPTTPPPPVVPPTQSSPTPTAPPPPVVPPTPTPTPTATPIPQTWAMSYNTSYNTKGPYNGYSLADPASTHFMIIGVNIQNLAGYDQIFTGRYLYVLDGNNTRYNEDQSSNPDNAVVVHPQQVIYAEGAYVVPDSVCNFTIYFYYNQRIQDAIGVRSSYC